MIPQKCSDMDPFQIEVTKGDVRGLELNVHMDSTSASIGSENSDHEAVMNTVEAAAYFTRTSLRYSKGRLRGMVREIGNKATVYVP